jgi:signal peptidase I
VTETDTAPTSPPELPPDGTGAVEAPSEENESLGRRAARSTIEWALIIGVAVLVAFIVKTFLIQAFFIPSASMEPELNIGDRVLVNKLSYKLHDVHRADIVVFERPSCDHDPTIKDLIKRVIGLPGETVEGRNGAVYVNGRRLAETYLPAGITTDAFAPVHVPAGNLWVMGDNRANSKDSRILCNGTTTFIPETRLVGRAFVRVWPITNFTLL